MDFLLTLLPVFLTGSLFVLLLTMLVHAVRHVIPNKVLWLIILLVTNVVGSIFYYFIVYEPMDKNPERKKFVRSMLGINLLCVVLIGYYAFMIPPHAASTNTGELQTLEEVALPIVKQKASSGEITRIKIKGDTLIITEKGRTEPSLVAHKESGSSLHEQGVSTKNIEIVIVP